LLSSQNHAGSGAGADCGHYSTVAQNRIDSSWYHVDSYIAPASHLHLLYHKNENPTQLRDDAGAASVSRQQRVDWHATIHGSCPAALPVFDGWIDRIDR
jgi:hypothetical protein